MESDNTLSSPGRSPTRRTFHFALTRGKEDNRRWGRILRKMGHLVTEVECISTRSLMNEKTRVDLEEGLSWADWIVVTSPRAVGHLPKTLEDFYPKVGVVGPRTAKTFSEAFYLPNVVAQRGTGERLGKQLAELPPEEAPKRVLYPSALVPRPQLKKALEDAGILVRIIPIYTVSSAEEPLPLEERVAILSSVDMVIFASPSGVNGFMARMATAGKVETLPPALTLGPTTTSEAKRFGLKVLGEAQERSLGGLLGAIPPGWVPQPRATS